DSEDYEDYDDSEDYEDCEDHEDREDSDYKYFIVSLPSSPDELVTSMESTNDLLGFDTMGFDPAHPEFDPFGCYENFSRWTYADGSQGRTFANEFTAQAGSASGSSGGPIIVENAAPQVRQGRTFANEFTAQAGSASGSSGGPIPATDPLENAAPQVRTYWQPGLVREAVPD
ncbi:hypothetical protein H0H93_014907, partial [Arthromyces matolae]